MYNVIVPAITALNVDGTFDDRGQENLTTYLAQSGVDAVFPLGLTGEFPHLDYATKVDVMNATAIAVGVYRGLTGKDTAILFGVNGETPEETISLVQNASRFKPQGLVLQLSKIDADDHSGFLDAVLAETNVPVFLYANPATAIGEEVVTPENLASYDRDGVEGIKISDSFERFKEYASVDCNLDLYMGNAMDIFRAFGEELPKKPSGVVTGPGNVFPREWSRAWNEQSEDSQVKTLFDKFRTLYYGIPSGKHTIAAIKHVLRTKGIIDSSTCYGKTLTEEDEAYLTEGFEQINGSNERRSAGL